MPIRNNFSGGWQPDSDTINCPDNAVLRMDNLVLDEEGILALRTGSTSLTGNLGTNVHSLFTTELSGTRYRMFGVDSKVYSTTTEIASSLAGADTLDMNFESHMGQIFFARSTVKKKYDGAVVRNWGIESHTQAITGASNTEPIVITANGHGLSDGTSVEITGVEGNTKANGFWVVESSGTNVFSLKGSNGLVTTTGRSGSYVANTGTIKKGIKTLAALAADSKFLATWEDGEASTITLTEQEGTDGATASDPADFEADEAGVANHAIKVVADALTGRAIVTRTLGSPTSFEKYTAQAATDDDILEFYVNIPEPSIVKSISVQVDVESGTFDTDYYEHVFKAEETISYLQQTAEQWSSNMNNAFANTVVPAGQIQHIRDQAENQHGVPSVGGQSATSLIPVVSKPGWNQLKVRRGNMTRVGSTDGKDWSTVKAVRHVIIAEGGNTASSTFLISNTKIVGGKERPLTGTYRYLYVLVNNNGEYQAKSAPSAVSVPISLEAEGATITIPAHARDKQANEIWLYRMGGYLDQYYRVGVKRGLNITGVSTGTPGVVTAAKHGLLQNDPITISGVLGETAVNGDFYVGGTTGGGATFTTDTFTVHTATPQTTDNDIDTAISTYVANTGTIENTLGQDEIVMQDVKSDLEAIIDNFALEVDVSPPPDDIIDIEGPYYDRLFVLTSKYLHPSKPLNPDSFASGEVIRVSSDEEEALWITKALGGLYIGTTRDIYRLDGTGALIQDSSGVVIPDFRKTPLNIGNPPISKAVAQEGNVMVYLASDGWREFNGTNSRPVGAGKVDLLYRGHTRHGVTPVNISDTDARFRAAIAKGLLVCLTPEGSSTGSSNVLHKYDIERGRWYRHVYTGQFQSIYREPDGTILGGNLTSGDGEVWVLEAGGTTQDAGVDMPGVVLHTKSDDLGTSNQRKDPNYLRTEIETTGTATVNTHLDEGSSAGALSLSSSTSGTSIRSNINTYATFTRAQLKVTGTFTKFKLREYELVARTRPPLKTFFEEAPLEISPVRRRFAGLTMSIDTLNQNATVTPVLDGVDQATFTVNTNDAKDVRLSFDEVVGRDLWAKILSTTGFELFGVAPISIETLPQQFKGQTPHSNFGKLDPKNFTAIKFKVCTLGSSVTVTPILDGTDSTTTLAVSTTASEPKSFILQFASLQTATEVALKFSGDVELYPGWEPVWSFNVPEAVKFWENKPEPSAVRRRFDGGVCVVDTGGEDVTVTPYLDGVAQSTLTLNTSDFVSTKLTFDTLVGHDLWFRLSGANTFRVMAVEPSVIETLPAKTKGTLPATNMEYDGQKAISGIRIRACTLGSERTFTPIFDGSASSTTLALTSTANDPSTDTLNLSSVVNATEIALKVDGDTEIYDWSPQVLYKLPAPKKVWDTGYVDLGIDDLSWIRQVKIKVKTPSNLVVTPHFDDTEFASYTHVVGSLADKTTHFEVPVGRRYKGRQPRIVVTAGGSEFFPYWIEFVLRGSGNRKRKKRIRVSA